MSANQPTRSDWSVVRRLLGYLSSSPLLLLGIAIALIMSAIGQAVAPTLIGQAIDQFITAGDRDGLARTMLLLLVVYVVGYIGFALQLRLMGILAQQLLLRMRRDIFAHVQKLSLGFFYREGAGDLMSRLVNDVDAIGNLFSQSLVQSIGSIVGLIGVIIAMVALNLPLAATTLLILPLMFLATAYFSRRSRVAYRRTRETIGQLSADLEEELTSVREAQAFARTALNIAHFEQDNAANRDANVQAAAITAAFAPTMDVLSTLGTALVAGVGGYLAFQGSVTVGVVVAFLTYVDRFFRPVQQISNLYTQMQSALAASDRVFDLLDTDPTIVDAPGATPLKSVEGTVVFDNVVFGYDEGTLILKGLSLTATPGETVALVGTTGAGKSTLVNLIGRFFDVNDGRVLIDGKDIRDLSVVSLREKIGEVPQDSFLFARSIADNIRYGQPDASLDDVKAASRAARAHDFIMALPEGYDTILSERGSSLSKGQRQLLCIARAILADPALLILDEATANIDTRTEQLVQEALDSLLAGRTAFVIAHRLSTIRRADQILVLEDGHVIEQGNHETLLASNGHYASLVDKQNRAA